MNTRTETPPVTTLLAWTDALNRHDADAAAAYFAPDADLTNAGTGTHAQGRDAIREEFKSYFAMFTDWAVEKTRTLSDGTWYAAEWVMTGVHTGDVPGLPATGRSFRVVGAWRRRGPRRADRAGHRVLQHGRPPHPGRHPPAATRLTGR